MCRESRLTRPRFFKPSYGPLLLPPPLSRPWPNGISHAYTLFHLRVHIVRSSGYIGVWETEWNTNDRARKEKKREEKRKRERKREGKKERKSTSRLEIAALGESVDLCCSPFARFVSWGRANVSEINWLLVERWALFACLFVCLFNRGRWPVVIWITETEKLENKKCMNMCLYYNVAYDDISDRFRV